MSNVGIASWFERADDAVFAVGQKSGIVTCAQWKDAVRRAARSLVDMPAGTPIAIDAGEPYPFTVLLAAVLWTGGIPVLIPGRGAQFEALRDAYDAVIVWESGQTYPKPTLSASRDAIPVSSARLQAPESERRIRLFTSGSSGHPKCVEKTIESMCREAAATARLFGEKAKGSVVLSTVDPRHLYGLTFNVWFALSAGLPIAAERRVYQEQIGMLHCPVSLITTPTFMRMMDTTLVSADLRFVLSAAGPLGSEALERMHQWVPTDVHEIYGSTETGVVASRCHSAGRMNADWQLIDEASLVETPQGWRLDSELLTEGSFLLDDRLEMTGAKTFRLLGRRDRIVKIGEVRLSLSEIERVVKDVLNLEIRALPIASGERTVIGAVVNTSTSSGWTGALPERRVLVSRLSGRLDPLALPRLWRTTPTWPVNDQGKIQTSALWEFFS